MTKTTLPQESASQQIVVSRTNFPSTVEYADYEEVSVEEGFQQDRPHFIEGNSIQISLYDLKNRCVVPTWADNTLTISHQNFITAVQKAALDVFPSESIGEPEIRVSHAQYGRIPSALHKKTSDLLPHEKTLYYQRVCFMIKVSRKDYINGREATLVVGGVRALNNENLGVRKSPEKFKIFIGSRVTVCSNLCIFGDAMIDKLECMSPVEIYSQAVRLFRGFDPELNHQMLESLGTTHLSVDDFTHIIGRMRLYEALSPAQRNELQLPTLTLGDSVLNAATRNFVSNPNFGIGNSTSITCWQLLNLLNEAVKSSYIDKFLQRMVQATDLSFGIMNAINGEKNRYAWFIQ